MKSLNENSNFDRFEKVDKREDRKRGQANIRNVERWIDGGKIRVIFNQRTSPFLSETREIKRGREGEGVAKGVFRNG